MMESCSGKGFTVQEAQGRDESQLFEQRKDVCLRKEIVRGTDGSMVFYLFSCQNFGDRISSAWSS